MKLSKDKESTLSKLFKEKFGVSLGHTTLQYTLWNIAVWNDDDIGAIRSNPKKILSELSKIWKENSETEKNTVVEPVLSELKFGDHKPLLYQRKENILTNLGMNNMCGLSTGNSSKTNSHCNIGDGSAAETVGDTLLANQLAIKSFSSSIGERITVNQQEKYATAFFREDFTKDVILKEAGICTGPNPPADIQISRVIFGDKPLSAGQSITVEITTSHRNGNQ